MTISLHLPNIASMRSISFAAVAAAAAIGTTLLVAGCLPATPASISACSRYAGSDRRQDRPSNGNAAGCCRRGGFSAPDVG